MTKTDIQAEAADALRHLALNESVKAYVLNDPTLYQALLRAARRFIGGETLEECVLTTKSINQQGHHVTIDFMGESTRDRETAQEATEEFLRVVETIQDHRLNASVSLDLSHVGMVIDEELGYENAARIAEAAGNTDLEMMISMESTDRTDEILNLHRRLSERFDNVGVTLQAYLYRTPSDLVAVMEHPGKIRLVKGAFEAPGDLAMKRGPKLNETYKQLVEKLLRSGHSCSIATHDKRLLDDVAELLPQEGFDQQIVEFEMLKGVAPEHLEKVRKKGFHTRVYLAYGSEWYLYLCNRLAEHPPNLYQALSDAVKSA